MREIKFRAWDKNDKRMIYFNGRIEFMYEYSCLAFHQKNHSVIDYEKDNYILMQYTGLKDKNGKEIYEEDICRWISPMKYIMSGCKKMEFINYEVKFLDGAFWLSEEEYKDGSLLRNACEEDVLYQGLENCEVIGNIHENKELLK